MDLPQINLADIPGLEGAKGLFGSITQTQGTVDDTIVDIMVYIYDTIPPEILG